MQIALVQPNPLCRDLAGNAQNGRRIAEGRSQRGQRVEGGRPRRANAYSDLAARPGIAISHEGRALLMSRKDVPDAAHRPQRVVNAQIVCARNAEHCVNVVRRQRTNNGLTTGHAH